MATTWPLTVEFDCPEPRVLKDRIVVSAGGAPDFSGWDLPISSDLWCDPITRTLMLAPLPVTSAWRSSMTGDYYRLHKADYTLTTGSAWVENHRLVSGNIWLEANGVNEVVTTTATYGANQPMYLNFYVPGIEELGETVVLECGWGAYGGGSTVWLRIRASGAITVYKGSTPVAVYDTQFSISPGTRGGTKSAAGHGIPMLLLPFRRRELLIYLGTSDSVSHVFADLDPESTSNTITPAGVFWWYVPTGRPSVQCAVCHFKETGTGYGPAVSMRYAPEIGRTYSFVTASDPVGLASPASVTATLVDSATLAPYTPDGVASSVRLKLAFSDNGDKTLGVYAIDAQFATTTTETVDDPIDVTERISELSLSVDEEGKAEVRLSTRNIAGMEDDGVEQVAIIGDRPVRIALGEVDIFRGTLAPPKLVPAEGRAYGVGDLLEWEGRDRSGDLEDYTFASAWAYDGIALTDAIVDIFEAAGFDAADLQISTDTFVLPYTPGVSFGEWQLYPERGDTASHWIDKLHADFAATWYKGWIPTLTGYTYRFEDPDELGAGPHLTLYLDPADAIAAGVSSALRSSRLVREVTRWLYRAEANQIQVIGQDRRTKAIIFSQYNDTASQTPGTATASRPENWRGKVLRYQLVDPDLITSQDAADRARDILRDRLTPTREVIEFSSDALVRDSDDLPIWVGDVVRIYELGRATYEDWRVRAIPSMQFTFEDLAGTRKSVRSATYRAWKIGSGP